MGTRGLVFIRCRGRYFVYYNHFDSYPEGLGEAIVQEIPEDPEEYRKWLESMREAYNELVDKFEQYLPVNICDSSMEGLSTRYRDIDDRLQEPPLRAILPEWIDQLFIEWNYTLDLDRELLGVDQAVYFRLDKIPRNGRWHHYLDLDYSRGQRTWSPETPDDIKGDAIYTPEVNRESIARYAALDIDIVPPTALLPDASDTLVPRDQFLLDIFKPIYHQFRDLLDAFVYQWSPDDFMFQEVSFAVLSLAAGEVSFASPRALGTKYAREGFYLFPQQSPESDGPQLLPEFLFERHVPGTETGSAPRCTTYWLGNVLINLATRLDLVENEEAAVADVVDAGLNQGLEDFYGLAFSLLDVVLIHVYKGDEAQVKVQKSDLMPLFYFDNRSSRFLNGPRSRPLQQKNLISQANVDQKRKDRKSRASFEQALQEQACVAFTMMMGVFNVASRLHLANTKSRVVPNEILLTIMQHADTQTYKNLASVSACCRDMCSRAFRLNDDYAIIGIENESGSSSRYIVEDLHSGERKRLNMKSRCLMNQSHFREDNDNLELNPVIGIANPARRSIIQSVTLEFPGLLLGNEHGQEEQESSRRSNGRPDNDDDKKLFRITDKKYPGFVAHAWACYVKTLIRNTAQDPYMDRFIDIQGASYECLLRPRYRELRLEPFYRNGFRGYLRHPKDEGAGEWLQLISYAVHRLGLEEKGNRDRYLQRGLPVIVAFGTRLKFFYYIFHCKSAPAVPPNISSSGSRFAAACTDPEPQNRFLQLIPGEDPLDLKDPTDRTRFEDLFRKICAQRSAREEWDPITEKNQPLIETNTDT
ncbi:hypothetical protein BDV25DRAFT_152064 [Aspergillus avenaceus]|uniref:F-box domain-containing protein n=1 Tax=Aspergillus avenaceus TaxID=36643 RepID=A0A5N6TZZ2_ASPAV|nr:hypothetical protein BDV25DRAFT_152064 [Aspergillus avenaceus]